MLPYMERYFRRQFLNHRLRGPLIPGRRLLPHPMVSCDTTRGDVVRWPHAHERTHRGPVGQPTEELELVQLHIHPSPSLDLSQAQTLFPVDKSPNLRAQTGIADRQLDRLWYRPPLQVIDVRCQSILERNFESEYFPHLVLRGIWDRLTHHMQHTRIIRHPAMHKSLYRDLVEVFESVNNKSIP